MSEEEFLDFPNSNGNTLTPIPVNGLGFEQHTLVSFEKDNKGYAPVGRACGFWVWKQWQVRDVTAATLLPRYRFCANACMHLDHALVDTAHEHCACCCRLLPVLSP